MTGAEDLVLGVDGGGSKTTARLADRHGTTVGEGCAGPSNWVTHGPDGAMRAISDAREAAFSAAGIETGTVRCTCLALAGAGTAQGRIEVDERVRAADFAQRVLVVHDAEPVLVSLPDAVGIALLAGTGSIAYGRSVGGRTARAGGLGARAGDEGSAYSIGAAGLRAGLVTLPSDTAMDTRSVAALAPGVTAAAADRDPIAEAVIEDAARALAAQAALVAEELGFVDGPIPLAMAGGVLVHCGMLRASVLRELESRGLDIDPTVVEQPVSGCVTIALR